MKQALTEALADESAGRWSWQLPMFVAAACLVERLLPGECDLCEGKGRIFHGGTHAEWGPCPTCHGNGQVWDEGIVEAVARAIFDSGLVRDDTAWIDLESDEEWIREEYRRHARAVLSAIAQLAEAGSQ